MTHENPATGAGVLLGLACGDALGRPVEGVAAKAIQNEHGTIEEMLVGRGPPGTVTDDTELALCIAQSLDEQREFNPTNIAARFLEWYESNPLSIGMTTGWALYDLSTGYTWDKAGKRAWEGNNASNGSVMRCAPLALAYHDDANTLVEVSKQSSVITHYDPRCVYGCAVLNLTLAALIEDADAPLWTALDHVESEAPTELVDALRPVCRSTDSQIDPATLESSGYVIDTLQTALYCGLTAESAEEGIVTAVNRGGDADTVGAVTGAVVGARFGKAELPDQWLATIDETPTLNRLAHSLLNGNYGISTESTSYDYATPEMTGEAS